MAGVRVLRILEYVYEDAETAAHDMARWTHSIGAANLLRGGMTMKSAVLPFEAVEWEEPDGQG